MYHAGQDIAFLEQNRSQHKYSLIIPRTEGVLAAYSHKRRPKVGTRSLYDTAIRAVLRDLHRWTATTLRYLDWQVGRRLWLELRETSFDIWRTFVEVYAQEANKDDFLDTTLRVLNSVPLPQGLDNPAYWLTVLSLHASQRSMIELMELCNMPSLAILLISGINARPGSLDEKVDDKLTRSWARSVTEANAFPSLKIVAFHCCSKLTAQCLEYLRTISTLKRAFFHDCTSMPDNHHYLLGISVKKRSRACSSDEPREGWECFDSTVPRVLGLTDWHVTIEAAMKERKSIPWLKLYTEELRRIQYEDEKVPESVALGIQDIKKPVLSVVWGNYPHIDHWPLAYRQIEHGASSDKPHSGADREKPNFVQSQGHRRRIKVSKYKETSDFTQFLV